MNALLDIHILAGNAVSLRVFIAYERMKRTRKINKLGVQYCNIDIYRRKMEFETK